MLPATTVTSLRCDVTTPCRPATFGGSPNAKWAGGANQLLGEGKGGHAVLSIWRQVVSFCCWLSCSCFVTLQLVLLLLLLLLVVVLLVVVLLLLLLLLLLKTNSLTIGMILCYPNHAPTLPRPFGFPRQL